MSKLIITDHPLIQHKITLMRKTDTTSMQFRQLATEVATLMGYEVTRTLQTREIEVETPMEKTTGVEISGKKVVLVPILRAGLGMVDGFSQLMPGARVGHIGLYRDPESLKPVEYYCKMPGELKNRQVILLDPMLATGGSLTDAATLLKERGADHIQAVCLIGAPEGVEAFQKAHPDIDLYLGHLDRQLNDHGYILPGLGDAGDRLFGTK
ncbi:MAG: uracil phosphoribosyltransferase [Peptoniphilus sp. oral taxon 375]|uniref:uracil phosphoribosyltransferase n=1 Tax=Urinicoccus timonensis TaxID=2024205 RepID=UPI00021A1BCA|nr:uracil phosphoribosyltransferase [Urinicoccus timonensis]EGS31746.1 uracil phosphoribosyltransferase [Peptoniphilus sp. oral taxon 375 str. F0436]KGF11501.1 uracil phosphoribosyltransferase [Tissierellia bacterium S5-A11]MBS4871560.1 uracil phosphoribosyltransferase [Peptoniphilus sp. oral taxon 375]